MRVYRVQGQDGNGPYNTTCVDHTNDQMVDVHSRFLNAHNSDYHNHPSAMVDSGLANVRWSLGMDDLFGFDSMTKLYAWFGGWVKPLLAMGFEIKVYEVPENAVTVSKFQAVFDRSKAIEIK